MGQWIMDNQWAMWLTLAVLLVVLEMFSLDLIFLMLSVGAAAGLLVSLAVDNLVIQILVAIAVALAMLFFARPSFVHRLHSGEDLTSGAQGLVGKEAFVIEPMTSTQTGRVKIGGDEWSALPADDSEIPAGTKVEVTAIVGATARVARIVRVETPITE